MGVARGSGTQCREALTHSHSRQCRREGFLPGMSASFSEAELPRLARQRRPQKPGFCAGTAFGRPTQRRWTTTAQLLSQETRLVCTLLHPTSLQPSFLTSRQSLSYTSKG